MHQDQSRKTLLPVFQQLSIQELHGQNANQLEKLETNQTVDHAGLSVQLKLCLIEFALPQVKPDKTDCQPKIWLLAADHADLDAKEVTQVLLGTGIRQPELFPEDFMETTQSANHTHWLHATTTPLVNTAHAQLLAQPQLAQTNVSQHTEKTTRETKESPLIHTMLILASRPSKLKS